MTDVRLTAVNPEDSQVYPVACNDKGELLLDSGGASGDLDVTGNLTVVGSGSFAAGKIDLRPGGSIQLMQGPEVKVLAQNSTSGGDLYLYGSTGNTSPTISITGNDGSATFTGGHTVDGGLSILNPGALFIRDDNASASTKIAIFKGGSTYGQATARIFNDGSSIFAGSVESENNFLVNAIADDQACFRTVRDGINTASILGNGSVNLGSSNKLTFSAGIGELTVQSDASYRKVFAGKLNTTETTVINADGSATFSGNVTAPNINFKLAPATVAAMPAPLIDEGFAANEELDLLSVIIEMKLQIRDLNAFMQRSTQDDPET